MTGGIPTTRRRALLAAGSALSASLAGCTGAETVADLVEDVRDGDGRSRPDDAADPEGQSGGDTRPSRLGAPFQSLLYDPETVGELDGQPYRVRYVQPRRLAEIEGGLPSERPTVERAGSGRSDLVSAVPSLRLEQLEERLWLAYPNAATARLGRGQFDLESPREVLRNAFGSPENYNGYELYRNNQYAIGLRSSGADGTFIEVNGESPEPIFRAIVDAEAGDVPEYTRPPMGDLLGQTLDGAAAWVDPIPELSGVNGLGASVRLGDRGLRQRVVAIGADFGGALGGPFAADAESEEGPTRRDVLTAAGYEAPAEEWSLTPLGSGAAFERTLDVDATTNGGDGGSDGSDDGDGGGGGGDSGTELSAEAQRWIESANAYDRIVDRTGRANVEVLVGGGEEGLAFEPPAIRINRGATVTWVWSDRGGAHDVVEANGRFQSGDPTEGPGPEFSHTFEEPGEYLYACRPHLETGQRGLIVVV